MSINWDNFKRTEGDYPDRWKPENPGDSISGRIAGIRVATMPDGNQYPSITLDTSSGQREVLASQSQLLQKMAAAQPSIGDTLTIRFTEIEKLNGGKTLKHFDVAVTKPDTGNTIL